MDNNSKKPFLNYEQQIDKLVAKKMQIDDHEKAEQVLKDVSYFGLINGYKGMFKHKDGTYHKGVTFDDIVSLYNFDAELRSILLKNILKAERKVKSLIAYYFCESYGDDQDAYLNVNNYEYDGEKREEINKLVNIFQELLDTCDQSKRKKYIDHYNRKHCNVPLWVIVNALTIGNMSKMYSLLKDREKMNIAKEYGLQRNELENMLKLVKNFRNICAHNERVFNYHSYSTINDNDFLNSLTAGEEKNKGEKRNILALLVCFKDLIDTKSYFMAIYEFVKLYKLTDLKHPYNKKVLSSMGLTEKVLNRLFSQDDFGDSFKSLTDADMMISKILLDININTTSET